MDSEQYTESPRTTAENYPLTSPPPEPGQGTDESTADNYKQEGKGSGNTAKELAREFRWVEWATVIINGGLAVIDIIALCVYSGQLNVMQGQLDQMATDSRPWIKVTGISLTTSETLAFNSGRMPLAPGESIMMFAPTKEPIARVNIRTQFHMKNVGRSVAQRVNVTAELFLTPSPPGTAITFTDPVGQEQDRFCTPQKNLKTVGPQFSRSAVFPDDDIAPLITAVGWIANGDITHRDGFDWVSPVLIGCVTYQEPKNFQTRIAYAVASLKSSDIMLGTDLNSEQIHFVRDERHEYAQ